MSSGAHDAALLGSLTPDMRLAAAYAPRATRPGVIALFAFDRALAQAVSRASQPIVGQIRLAWWRDFLNSDARGDSADPIASAIGALANDRNLRAHLAAMVNGWERLLEPFPIGSEALADYATGRGHGLFGAVATLEGRHVESEAGRAWALIDFAFRCSDADTAARALLIANEARFRLPRPLAILDRFARRDIKRGLARGTAESQPSRLWDALSGAFSAK